MEAIERTIRSGNNRNTVNECISYRTHEGFCEHSRYWSIKDERSMRRGYYLTASRARPLLRISRMRLQWRKMVSAARPLLSSLKRDNFFRSCSVTNETPASNRKCQKREPMKGRSNGTFSVFALLFFVIPDCFSNRVALFLSRCRQNLVLLRHSSVELVDARVDERVRLTTAQVPKKNTKTSLKNVI